MLEILRQLRDQGFFPLVSADDFERRLEFSGDTGWTVDQAEVTRDQALGLIHQHLAERSARAEYLAAEVAWLDATIAALEQAPPEGEPQAS